MVRWYEEDSHRGASDVLIVWPVGEGRAPAVCTPLSRRRAGSLSALRRSVSLPT